MKNQFYLLAMLILFGQQISAQNISISDVNFKNKILSSNPGNTVAKNLAGNYFSVDMNGDGEIQQSEASQVKSLDLSFSNISSMVEITDFINLEMLACNNNNINKLYLSSMNSIKWVNASYNNLNNGGISVGPNIEYIDLHNVSLSPGELNLSNKNKLSYLNLQNSNIYDLNCSNSKLTTLLLNGCSNLHVLNCSNNLLTALDLSGLNITGEAYYLGSGQGTLTSYKGGVDCSHNNLTSLNINNLTTNFLNCSYNNLGLLNATSLTLIKMPTVHVYEIPEPSIYFDCSHNQLTSLLTNGSFIVQYFDCSYNNLNTLNIPNIVTQFFSCNNNNLTSLNISNSSKINSLNLSHNLLTSFVSPALPEVDNPYAFADIYNSTRSLNCSDNQLTFLDLNNTQIISVNASNNNINTLLVKNGILNEFINLQNNLNIEFVCADNIPLDSSSPPYTEVNYYQDMLPGATVGSDCNNIVLATDVSNLVKENIKIYPNPSKDFINISADSIIKSIEIYDVQGRIVKVISGNNTKTVRVEIENISVGIYILKAITEKGSFTEKIHKIQ